VDAGLGRRAERYVPRAYALVPLVRYALPSLYRRALQGGRFTPVTPASPATQAAPSRPAGPPSTS
jgi:hypothetical protein